MRRPTLDELRDRIIADFEALPLAQGSIARLSIERALARVLAALADGLYGYLDHVLRQLLPTTGDADAVARWADMLGMSATLAKRATGQVTLTGTDGSVVHKGAKIEVDGASFEVVADQTLAAGSATVSVIASDTGSAFNKAKGQTAWLIGSINGVDPRATVPADIGGGAGAESVEHLRARILARLGHTSRGGAKGDWVVWAMEVSGVTRAWEYPWRQGLGSVDVAFVRDGDTNPIPDAAEVAQVQAHLDAIAPFPMRAVNVWAPVGKKHPLTIRITPRTTQLEADVTAALNAAIRKLAEPETAIALSVLSEVISAVPGETAHRITLPAADQGPGTRAIWTGANITFEDY